MIRLTGSAASEGPLTEALFADVKIAASQQVYFYSKAEAKYLCASQLVGRFVGSTDSLLRHQRKVAVMVFRLLAVRAQSFAEHGVTQGTRAGGTSKIWPTNGSSLNA